jgi:hypothetical protein
MGRIGSSLWSVYMGDEKVSETLEDGGRPA